MRELMDSSCPRDSIKYLGRMVDRHGVRSLQLNRKSAERKKNVARIRHDRTLEIAFGLQGSHGQEEKRA